MKKIVSILCVLVLLFSAMPVSFAADNTQEFAFNLSVDGKTEKQVQPGDVITVTFVLERADSNEPYQMYGMQNEIRYDDAFFQLVPENTLLASGIRTTDLAMTDGVHREFYMNFLDQQGGTTWNARTVVGSFQLKVIAQTGTSRITNQNYLVSGEDGQSAYPVSCQNVTVTVAKPSEPLKSFRVRFVSNGGTPVAEQQIPQNGQIRQPGDPVRDGYRFDGWYRDAKLQTPWNFNQDTVSADVTLYAKWVKIAPKPTQPDNGNAGGGTSGGNGDKDSTQATENTKPAESTKVTESTKPAESTKPTEAKKPTATTPQESTSEPVSTEVPSESIASGREPGESGGNSWLAILGGVGAVILLLLLLLLLTRRKVQFVTGCEAEIEAQRVFRERFVKRPPEPHKSGAMFAGWYQDPEFTKRWDFEKDRVKENMTLYAKWI